MSDSEWQSAETNPPPTGTDVSFRVGTQEKPSAGYVVELRWGKFMRSEFGDFALSLVSWKPLPTERERIIARLDELTIEERAEFAKQEIRAKGEGWAATEWIREERGPLVRRLRALERAKRECSL